MESIPLGYYKTVGQALDRAAMTSRSQVVRHGLNRDGGHVFWFSRSTLPGLSPIVAVVEMPECEVGEFTHNIARA